MPVNVTIPLPALRAAIPIHQCGTMNSWPPRGPPCWLNAAKTMPSCMNCHPPTFVWACSSCVAGASWAAATAIRLNIAAMTTVTRHASRPKRIMSLRIKSG